MGFQVLVGQMLVILFHIVDAMKLARAISLLTFVS